MDELSAQFMTAVRETPLVIGALATATATIVVFVLTQCLALVRREWIRRETRARTRLGLLVEVDVNLSAINEFIAANPTPPPSVIAAFRRRPNWRPHWPFARHSGFYEAARGNGNLVLLSPGEVGAVVRFYESLETLRTEIEGLALETFASNSHAGKVQRLEIIWDEFANCSRNGTAAWQAVRRRTRRSVAASVRLSAGADQASEGSSQKERRRRLWHVR